MQLSDELELSYYKEVAEINGKHNVMLVQHTETGKFYCKKQLTSYNSGVFLYLRDHPVEGIPRIYVVVEDAGTLIVIEEYIQGETLQERMDRDGPMPAVKAAEMAIQLCEILSRLHHLRPPIIHRDIKPSNLILTPDDKLVLVDLNTAKFADPGESRDTELLGTSGYAAPEQYGFGSSDVQTDVYAVGVLLNVMTTGHMPSERKAAGEIGRIIDRCTELKPEDRFRNVDTLELALKAFMRGDDAPGPGTYRRKDTSWHRFLPPGFRTGFVPKMIIAVMGYALIIVLILSLDLNVGGSTASRVVNQIVYILAFFAIIFFAADYDGVLENMPITRSANMAVRVLGIILYSVLLLVVVTLLIMGIESALLL